MDEINSAGQPRNFTARRAVSPENRVSVPTVIDPANSAETGPRPPLFAAVLRGYREEAAAPLVPDFTLPVSPSPHQADLDLLTGAMNLMAVRSGAMWTLPAAYSGQLADTVINAAAVTPPGRRPGPADDDGGDTPSVAAPPSSASGGRVSL